MKLPKVMRNIASIVRQCAPIAKSILFVIVFCSLLGCTTALIDHLDAQLRPLARTSFLQHLLQRTPFSTNNHPPQAVFDSPSIRKTIVDVIQTAPPKSTLFITTYIMTDPIIKEVLIDAHKRDVILQVVADSAYAYGERSQIPALIKAGISVYLYKPPLFDNQDILGKMHNKIIIREEPDGNGVVITGSYNLTNSAAKYNEENIVLIYDPTTRKAYNNHFAQLLEKSIRAKIPKINKAKNTFR